MRYNIKPRVTVDWNNDYFLCRYARPGDALNLLPSPLSYTTIDKATFGGLGAAWDETPEETDYGLNVFYTTTGTHAFGGFILGQGAGGVVDTIPISRNTLYRATCWVKGVSGSYGATPIRVSANDEAFVTLATSPVITLTNQWQKVSFTFTSGAASDFLYYFVFKNNSATNIVHATTGFMLTLGSTTPQGYNTGDASDLYENITSDVLAANWETGKTDQRTRVPSEGVANLTVNNSTRRYSPRLSSSPIYGLMKKQLRVSIEAQYLSTTQYITLWNGYTKDYSINAGVKNPTIGIDCEQGIFALDGSSPTIGLLEDTTASEVIEAILDHSSFKSAHTPYGFYVDKSVLDDTWVAGYAMNGGYPTVALPATPDPVDIPLAGDAWMDGNTSPRKMLEDTVQIDQGYLLVLNSGQLRYMDRKEIMDAATSYDIVIDDNVSRADYGHAEYMVNRVNAAYYPDATEDDVILWSSRQPIKLARGKTKTVKAEFKYNDKEKMTVTAVNPFSGVATPSVLTAVNTAGTSVTVGIIGSYDLENGTAKIFLKNTTTDTVFISLVLKGSRTIQVDNEGIEAAADEIDTTVDKLNINNRLVRDEEMALDLASWYITTYSQPFDQFKQLTIKPRNETILSVAMASWPGTIVSLTEYQTNMNAERHIVLGSGGEYRPGKDLTIELYLGKADLTTDYIVGVTTLGDGGELAY